jgi:pyruvate dehydrogenase E2 component (dihydrolipoamide acetyltransferase)
MATKVMMEALSPTMEEGRLVKWLKNEGDAVSNGETIAEVETDKAIMELVARGEGVLRARLLAEGETTAVGSLIGVIAAADEDISSLTGGGGTADKPTADKTPDKSTAAPKSTEQTPPAADDEAEKAVPESEAQHAVSAETPDAAGAEAAPAAGEAAPAKGEGDAPPAEGAPQGESKAAKPEPTSAAPAGGPPRSSPLARRLAHERGIQLGEISGSGPGGRIIKRDIEAAASRPAAATAAAGEPAQGAPASTGTRPTAVGAPAMVIEGEYKDVPLTQMRKTIARRLGESIGPIPTFYLTSEIDMTNVGELREQMVAAGDQFKVSVNDIVMKAVAIALTRHPECNAHWMGDHIRYFSRVHLGMAVATDEGLIVPVITDAHTKGLGQIGRDAKELAKRARERKLAPNEYSGSTFSVSNLGMFGIDDFTAIINPPESAILAIGGIETKPVFIDGEFEPRRRMRVTMSCDHRVIDGAVGARFLQTLRQLLESPMMMLF